MKLNNKRDKLIIFMIYRGKSINAAGMSKMFLKWSHAHCGLIFVLVRHIRNQNP